MNSSSNNHPRPAAVEQGALPALPDWCFRDDLGGLVPSEIRTALNEHARAAWNMGLDAGLLHAPAVTDTGLPELRDHLATAKVMDRSITLSPAAADALYLAMTTPPATAPSNLEDDAGWLDQFRNVDGAVAFHLIERHGNDWADCGRLMLLFAKAKATAPQVAGYIEPQEIPCIGQCRTTLWATKQRPGAMAVYLPAPAAPPTTEVCAEMRALCSSCGGTGDVTRIDGEWLGYCNCGSAK